MRRCGGLQIFTTSGSGDDRGATSSGDDGDGDSSRSSEPRREKSIASAPFPIGAIGAAKTPDVAARASPVTASAAMTNDRIGCLLPDNFGHALA